MKEFGRAVDLQPVRRDGHGTRADGRHRDGSIIRHRLVARHLQNGTLCRHNALRERIRRKKVREAAASRSGTKRESSSAFHLYFSSRCDTSSTARPTAPSVRSP